MYLMTSLRMIFVPIAFMFSPISISGGGVRQPEPKCHFDLVSNIFIPGGGGVHQPEAKCHLDLESNFFIPGWGGGGYISQNQNVTLT